MRFLKSGVKCHNCGSKIDHFGATPADAMQAIATMGQPDGGERHRALMRSIGGTCPQCRKVCCSQCYYDHRYVCPNCGEKIPDLTAG